MAKADIEKWIEFFKKYPSYYRNRPERLKKAYTDRDLKWILTPEGFDINYKNTRDLAKDLIDKDPELLYKTIDKQPAWYRKRYLSDEEEISREELKEQAEKYINGDGSVRFLAKDIVTQLLEDYIRKETLTTEADKEFENLPEFDKDEIIEVDDPKLKEWLKRYGKDERDKSGKIKARDYLQLKAIQEGVQPKQLVRKEDFGYYGGRSLRDSELDYKSDNPHDVDYSTANPWETFEDFKKDMASKNRPYNTDKNAIYDKFHSGKETIKGDALYDYWNNELKNRPEESRLRSYYWDMDKVPLKRLQGEEFEDPELPTSAEVDEEGHTGKTISEADRDPKFSKKAIFKPATERTVKAKQDPVKTAEAYLGGYFFKGMPKEAKDELVAKIKDDPKLLLNSDGEYDSDMLWELADDDDFYERHFPEDVRDAVENRTGNRAQMATSVLRGMDKNGIDETYREKFLEWVSEADDPDYFDERDKWEESDQYKDVVYVEDNDPVIHERYEELADEMNKDNPDPIGDRTINEASQILPQDYNTPKTRSRQEAVDRLKDIHQQHKLDDNFDNIIAQLKLLREGKDSKESLMDYLDEQYPEATPKAKPGDSFVKAKMPKIEEAVEKAIEEHPAEAEKALESMGESKLAEEAKQVNDGDKRTDEVNDAVVNKVVAKAIEEPKKEKLNEGYEDGMLKRTEEQQAEFDRIKAESDKAAEEWRKQQFDKFANPEPERAPKAEPRVESSPEPDAEPVQLSDDDIKEEMKRFSGNKKKHKGKGKLEDLEALEFNPEEFAKLQQENAQQEYEKKYGNKKPEEAIKEELDEDEMNDMEYKPSEEELKALHDANREEWIAKGRPRNDPDKSIEIDPNLMQKQAEEQNAELDKQVEKAIESNPEQAAESAPEGSNIEQEAEQAANPEGNSGEVNDAEIAEEPDATKQQFVNDIEPDQNLDSYPEAREQYTPGEEGTPEFDNPELASLDLSEDEMMGGSISNDEMQQIEAQMNQAQPQQPVQPNDMTPDATLAEGNNDLPELELEQIPQEEIDRIFKPLNAEIEKLGKDLKDREDILELAQRHFDENPNDENAIALNKANQQYQDAQYLLNKRQDEYVEAYKNLGNYYQAKKPQEETPEEEKNTLGLHFRDTPLPVNAPNGGSNSPISISKHDTPRAGIGSLAGYGKPMNVTGSHGSAHGVSSPHSTSGNPSYTSGAKTGMARPGVVTDNISARRAPVMTGRNSESQGYVNHNGGGLTSGGTRGGLWNTPHNNLPNGGGHSASISTGLLQGGSASKGMGSLRMALIARIHKLLNSLPPEEVRAMGFSPKDHHYKTKRLEDLPGETLRQIADMLQQVTNNTAGAS